MEGTLLYLSIPTSFHIIASYVHYFFILPPLIRSKRIVPYVSGLILLLIVIFALRIPIENHVIGQMFPKENYYKTLALARIISTTWDTMTFLIFTGMIRFTFDWFNLENKKKQLENEKLVAELNYLKAQINPHFLFNTLHNLNYLVYSKKKLLT
jgi:sensor histidine kinase YesM